MTALQHRTRHCERSEAISTSQNLTKLRLAGGVRANYIRHQQWAGGILESLSGGADKSVEKWHRSAIKWTIIKHVLLRNFAPHLLAVY
jgi:hypothetical protein